MKYFTKNSILWLIVSLSLFIVLLASCNQSQPASQDPSPTEVSAVSEGEPAQEDVQESIQEDAETSDVAQAEGLEEGDADESDEAESDEAELSKAESDEAEANETVADEDSEATTDESSEVSEEVAEGEGGEHAHGEPNRLIDEKSPYLLQHAYNPVDWYPWGPEAFEKARAEGKPIFLSIGYSTCHWCHVMEDESFEDEEVAALMNEHFIAIKVDREERPDIDDIYMTSAQLMRTRGGWPLNAILTPEQKPFYIATYIPKESRFQRAGMMELIPQLDEVWQTRRDEVLVFADEITNALQPPQMSQMTDLSQAEDLFGPDLLATAYQQLGQRFDPVYGGFATAPKFPSPHNMLFLLRYWQRTGDEQALYMVETTLQAMHKGGVYDQIGFGFHRYSTDQEWKLPHFEKMLYDQAMLSLAYTEAYQATDNPEYERIARQIFTYVLRDMTDEQGGFYSAEDADSEGEEGIFYHWSIEELNELLGEERANILVTMAGMTEEGNFLEEATREATGKNIIYWSQPPARVAEQLGLSLDELYQALESMRPEIFAERKLRIHPYKDDKILTDWNGLMIAAFAKAGRAFHEPEYTEAAVQAADFVLTTLLDEDGRLIHRYRDGEAGLQANIDDYTFMVWGLLELYEATFNLDYLTQAIALTDKQLELFWDDFVGGFYFTPNDGEKLISRPKAIYDGAIPSGNSVSMLNLLRIGRITADARYEEQAAQLAQAFAAQITNGPTAYTQLMSALEFGIGPSYEVIIVGEEGGSDTEAMLTALRDQYVPNKVVLLRGPEEDAPLAELIDYTSYYYAIDDKATAYVCQDYICEFPTNDPEQMVTLLKKEDEVRENEKGAEGDEEDAEKAFPTQGNTHIPFGSQSPIAYNSIPPSSGPHYDNLAAWKVYQSDEPQRYELLNHNLEDGGVVFYYQCEDGCPELLNQLEALVRPYLDANRHVAVVPNDPTWVDANGLTIHQDMGAKIAAVAWRRVLKMDEFDGEKLRAFIERYEGIDNHVRS